MFMKPFFIFSLIFIISLKLFSQNTLPNFALNNRLKNALERAEDNRVELQKALKFFGEKKIDSLKLKALIYLIENMGFHQKINYNIIPDPKFLNLVNKIDTLYYNLVKNKSVGELKSMEHKIAVNNIKTGIEPLINNILFAEPSIKIDYFSSDLNTINSKFLIEHIENAFELREKSPFIKKLSFDNFLEYTIPYRQLDGHNFESSGKKMRLFFSKYLGDLRGEDLLEKIERYNITIADFRTILGKYPLKSRVGFEELLFSEVSNFDCFSVANFGASILNACGVPVDISYNSAYKQFQGRHSGCGIAKSLGNWSSFNPESSLPTISNPPYKSYENCLNMYRVHFSEQLDNPFHLGAKDEYIPDNLASPLIEDVTLNFLSTLELTLPIDVVGNNKLAYLETFSSSTGTIPVTWGMINKNKSEVNFKKVIPDRLYFLTYYQGEQKKFIKAFYLSSDSLAANKYKITEFPFPESGKTASFFLTEKFPEKPALKKMSEEMVGTVILGFNKGSTKKDTLFTIGSPLQPYLQDLELNNAVAYDYYRIQMPKSHSHFDISEAQFLSNKKYNYENVVAPAPLPIFPSKNQIKEDLVRLLQGDLDKISKWPEYDSNQMTAPSAYSNITFNAKSPQVVTTIRVAPKNANNGINIGDKYLLLYWDKNGWASTEPIVANSNFLEYKKIPSANLFWLKNLTKGTEELPFVIKDKKQQFFYQ